MARHKKDFLTFGNIRIPEASEVEALISNLQAQFHHLYYVLDLAEKLENERYRLTPGLETVPIPATRYSVSGAKGLNLYLGEILEDAKRLQLDYQNRGSARATKALKSCINHLTRVRSAPDDQFPDYDGFSEEFTEAIEMGRGRE
jgi:hypothetical protein